MSWATRPYPQESRQAFVDALVQLRHTVREGKQLPTTSNGICANLRKWMGNTYAPYFMVQFYAQGWEHHSNREEYPVPVKSGYFSSRPWSGEQRTLRIDLMTYIIGKVFDEGGVSVEEPDDFNDVLRGSDV